MTSFFILIKKFIEIMILKFGYLGIMLAMAIESACIPLPSEVIMPFSGFLVALGKLNFWLVTLFGAIGCLLGSTLAWWLGKNFGEDFIRRLIRQWGKFIFIFEYELDEAICWFNKYGERIIFTSRLLPVVRTFISLPAGMVEMNYFRFALYTIIGSLIWSAALGFIGFKLGKNWQTVEKYFHQFDFLLILVFLSMGVFYFYHKIKRYRHWKQLKKNEKI